MLHGTGVQSTGVGRLALHGQIVGYFIRTLLMKKIVKSYGFMHKLVNFQATKMPDPILNPCIKGTRVEVMLDCPNREVLLKGKAQYS